MWKRYLRPGLIFVGMVYGAGLAIPVLATAIDKLTGGALSKAEGVVAGLTAKATNLLPGVNVGYSGGTTEGVYTAFQNVSSDIQG